jgi:hypothetical protein
VTGPHQDQYPQQPQQPQYPQEPQYPQQPPYPPPAPQQQPYPPPRQGPSDGQPAIVVNTMYMWIAFMLAFFKPKIFVNGHEFPAVWGHNVIPVSPGQHHLHVHVPYLLPPKFGPADVTVPVHPGQPPVELEYRAPVFAFVNGSLGPPPQRYNGMGAQIGLMVGVLVLFCLCCGANLLAM